MPQASPEEVGRVLSDLAFGIIEQNWLEQHVGQTVDLKSLDQLRLNLAEWIPCHSHSGWALPSWGRQRARSGGSGRVKIRARGTHEFRSEWIELEGRRGFWKVRTTNASTR